jgi:hypothetical protein
MIDDRQPSSRRPDRLYRWGHVTVVIVCASLAIYWLARWLRGDPSQEVVGGLTLSTGLALVVSAELVRSGRMRWTLMGIGTVVFAIGAPVIFSGVRVSALTVLAFLLCAGSVVAIARALWPARGVRLAEWRRTPTTLEQRRATCAGLATLHLGAAVLWVSLFDLTQGPWLATAVVVSTTLLFLSAAVGFLVLRRRLRTRLRPD